MKDVYGLIGVGNRGGLIVETEIFLLAAAPIAVLLIMLLLLRQSVLRAAAFGLLLAVCSGLSGFDGTWAQSLAACLKGIKDSLPIIAVVFVTLFLYAWAEKSGALRRLQDVLVSCSADTAVQALLLGWLFVHALQGVSGFGVPVLVGAPLLVKIGLSPFRAVLIALLGQCWGNTFGTLGLAWNGLLTQVTLTNGEAMAAMTAASSYLVIVCVLTGFMIAWLAAGFAGLCRTFWLVLVLGLLQGEGQTLFSYWSPEMANFLASLLGLGGFFFWQKAFSYRQRSAETHLSETGEKQTAAVLILWQKDFLPAFARYACKRTWPVAAAIMLLLAMSEVMVTAGETKVLAFGMAEITGPHYLAAAPFVGLLGSFMTASNLSSNILFASFQQQMAVFLGLSAEELLALQTAGGAVGTLLSPSNIFLGTTAVGIVGAEGKILHWTLAAALFFCALFSLLSYVVN